VTCPVRIIIIFTGSVKIAGASKLTSPKRRLAEAEQRHVHVLANSATNANAGTNSIQPDNGATRAKAGTERTGARSFTRIGQNPSRLLLEEPVTKYFYRRNCGVGQMSRTLDLGQQVAIVTGGGQGIGRQTALTFAAAGARVAINFFPDSAGQNHALAAQVAKEIAALYGTESSAVFAADVRDAQQVEGMYTAVLDKFSRLDIVVNNAGILRDRSIKKMTLDEWTSVIDTNLSGVFHSCQQAALKLSPGGRIINVASLSAVMGFFGQANYAAAKSGVLGLTKVLARELAKSNIRVNAVAPGVVDTEMGQSIPEENRKVMQQQIPLGRFAEPREISDVILFLASDLSSYMTGQTLHVNGGWWF
jgi:NAD(P)-dependent dehydrogenase (short-subunit alcohol dehydrogenase family)